ncbi:hypothetical protein GGQ91_005697 [Methylobacterium fujisawaense]|uniref:Uncharacterized protein n=1 Tax=Methylobacterium fujisawaense TaxID=107400 RepID=A0ABR6DJK6_9HYPH|nr:hypothetical protein [Methylobacterium fujisawaense]MBA9066268.1 hypothetical protein [Methylobacterium fujisawaense]
MPGADKEAADLFSDAFKKVIDAVKVATTSGSIARDVDIFFPRGIGYVEFSITDPIAARIVVSSEVPGNTPADNSQTEDPDPGILKSMAQEPVALLEGDYGFDPEVDPDVNEPKTPISAAATPKWRVAKSLEKLRQEINSKYPNRSKSSDGTIGNAAHCHGGTPKTSDHCAWVRDGELGVVTALDITHDPAHSCDAGKIAEALIASKDTRIKYVIWNKQIAASYQVGTVPAWHWRPYTGKNPHSKHFHISVNPEKILYDDVRQWSF